MASSSPNPVTCRSPHVPREPQPPEGARCSRCRSHRGLGLTLQVQAVGSPLTGPCGAVLGPDSEPTPCQLHRGAAAPRLSPSPLQGQEMRAGSRAEQALPALHSAQGEGSPAAGCVWALHECSCGPRSVLRTGESISLPGQLGRRWWLRLTAPSRGSSMAGCSCAALAASLPLMIRAEGR